MFRALRRQLSASEATQLAERLAEVTEANLPLVDGLRAASTEISNRRVKSGLLQLADRIQGGTPFPEDAPSNTLRIPPYLAGLLQAGMRTGSLGEVLSELADYYRDRRDSWRRIRLALSYPFSLLVLLTFVTALMMTLVVPQMHDVFLEFDTEMPPSTNSLIWFSETGWRYFAGAAVVSVVSCLLVRVLGGAAPWMRVVGSIPVFGGLFLWQGFAEFAHLLRLLLLQEVPLPEALRLTSAAVRNASVARTTSRLATSVEQGQTLAEGMNHDSTVPGSLISLVRVGERNDELASSLQACVEMLEGHIALRSQLLISVFPPMMFILVAGITLLILYAMISPLVSLISNLT